MITKDMTLTARAREAIGASAANSDSVVDQLRETNALLRVAVELLLELNTNVHDIASS